MVLNVKKSTNLSGLYGELGRVPLLIYREISMIRYWIKLISGVNFIPKKVYIMLKNDADNNITYNGLNWAYQSKCILEIIGLSCIWNDQFFLDTGPFTLIKQRLIDMYQQTWYASINNSIMHALNTNFVMKNI